jgi:pyruvate dehydrogenase E2 component (dihydrolipoamide acetyltransferase)
MTQVTLPELGDGIESGDILEIFVSVGDVISAGQDIVEMETDKATVPVPASVGGKVTKILVNEGDTVPIGGAILEIEASAHSKPAAIAPASERTAPEPIAAEPQPEPEPKPQAIEPEPTAPAPVETSPEPEPVPLASEQEPVAVASQQIIAAGPAVRRFAREVGIDLSNVKGSGSHGRITRDDVLAVVRTAGKTARAQAKAVAAPVAKTDAAGVELPGTPGSDDYGTTRTEKMNRIRKTIAKQMHASWTNVPRVTNFDDADITDLEQLRQSSKEDYAAQGLKLTTMPFLIKAVATALCHNPTINAVIDTENDQIIYKDYVNVGIAVDTDRGLVVPVMHNADSMGVPEIARALAEMAGKVRGGKFRLSDIRGGTFSISNLGAIGGHYSTPIINLPEVAILLVGRSRKLPVVMSDNSIQPRLMMPLSISYDHRLVDGATAARFLNDVIGYLEAPSRLLLAL